MDLIKDNIYSLIIYILQKCVKTNKIIAVENLYITKRNFLFL